ncbi:hypothetical protein [Blastomonas sp.]|uniref:hypothetical protein n=1 Tax=Blastomonas sp. TaxID=1909299 RepID=UPI00261C3B00|nr:hypothetical protein [Blastomonas sp.]MDM7957845.1 hypothetical protein [Blastomonas sp.]
MSFATKTLTLLMLLATTAMAQAAEPARPVTGTWTTDFGTVRLIEDRQGGVRGSYDTDDGRITGKIENDVMDGFWVETASDYTCETLKMGSPYWGRIRFELNSARTGWTGIWSYCDYEYVEGNVWNGSRAPR